jgi:hypothetical protein
MQNFTEEIEHKILIKENILNSVTAYLVRKQ